MNDKVLLIEDDKDMVELVTYSLTRAGYHVTVALTGSVALRKANTEHPDLILLDIMLPDLDGTEICKALRAHPSTATVPIIFVTAKGEEIDRLLGFELGANDYVTKPFSLRELIARIKVHLRESATLPRPAQPVVMCGNLSINLETRKVTKENEKIELTPVEFKLLHFLAANKEKVFSRDQLLAYLWHEDAFVIPRTIDVHVRRLREKIEQDPNNPSYIITVRGFGYKLICPS